jgi:transmembrane protein EpsG
MVLYVIAFFATTALIIFKERSPREAGLFIAFLLILALVGLRNEQVGNDTSSYYNIYWLIDNNPKHVYVSTYIEPLYRLLNRCVLLFNGGPEAVIFISTLIIFALITRTIDTCSPSPLLSLAVLYGLGPFFFLHSGVRQGIAIGLVFYGITFITQKKIIKYLITVIIAVGFHYSAIVFLPMYFLLKIRLNRLVLTIIWLISLPFLIKKDMVFSVLQKLLFFIPERYLNLALNSETADGVRTGIGVKQVFMQLVFVVLLYAYKKIKVDTHNTVLYFSIIGIILSNVLYWAGYIERITGYFDIFIVLSLPVVTRYMFKRNDRILVSYSLYCVCLLFFLRTLITDPYGVIPYHTVFN